MSLVARPWTQRHDHSRLVAAALVAAALVAAALLPGALLFGLALARTLESR